MLSIPVLTSSSGVTNTSIMALPENLFARSPLLKAIGLEGNRITAVPSGLFTGLKKLETLYVCILNLYWSHGAAA